MRFSKIILCTAAAMVLAAACSAMAADTKTASLKDFHVHINGDGMSKAPAAQDDFYLHVNYKWFRTHKIPATDPDYGAFSIVGNRNIDRLSAITKECVKNRSKYKSSDDEARIADMRACIADIKGREKAGLGGLAKPIAEIEKVSSLKEYALLMARLGKDYGINCLVGGFSVMPDPIKADRYVVGIEKPGLGLGKEFLSQPRNEEYFQYYRNYVRDILTLYGMPKEKADKTAKAIFALQKDLSDHALSKAEIDDPSKSTHKLDLKQLCALYSNFDVPAMLKEANIGPDNGVKSWYVQDPELIKYFNSIYTPDRLQLFKDYAIFDLIGGNASVLTKQYADLSDEFDRKLSGAQKLKTADKRADELCQGLMPLHYGRIYAKKYFDEKTRKEMRSYIDLVMGEYKKKLAALSWMSPATKKQAIKKLDTMIIRIGYPSKWPAYLDAYKVVPVKDGGTLIDNALKLSQLSWQDAKNHLGKLVDRTEWSDPPQTVNASYDPSDNSINFPAGALQPPFFDLKADRDTNLGGIGMFIAHEMTHSFDSNGSQYDENGALRNWWTDSDKKEYSKRLAGIERFYNRYMFQKGLYQDGKQTMSENIADLGSLSCLTDIVGDDIPGLKKLYTNFARIWADKIRDAYLRLMLTDVHSVPHVRVDAVMSSTDGFYKAFDVKPGDGMYVKPEDRARLW